MIERELLGGIKEQLLDPKVVMQMTRKIRRQARVPKRVRVLERVPWILFQDSNPFRQFVQVPRHDATENTGTALAVIVGLRCIVVEHVHVNLSRLSIGFLAIPHQDSDKTFASIPVSPHGNAKGTEPGFG